MRIIVLEPACCGSGRLETVTRRALERAGIEAQVEVVDDWETIMGYGVLSTPGLVVDGKVKAAGFVPSVEEIVAMLSGAAS